MIAVQKLRLPTVFEAGSPYNPSLVSRSLAGRSLACSLLASGWCLGAAVSAQALTIPGDRRIRAGVITPLGTQQAYELGVP